MQHVGRMGTLVGFSCQVGAAGAAVIWPDQKWVGWSLFIVSCIVLATTLAWWLRTNRIHIRDWLKRMEPTHLIAIGLVVAAAGVIWQLYRPAEAKQNTIQSESSQTSKSGNPLQDAIDAFLAKRGKSITWQLGGLIQMADASDGKGPFIAYWDQSMGPWPELVTGSGFTQNQLRKLPRKVPRFTTQFDKENFRTAIGDLLKITNNKVADMISLSENTAGISPIVAKGRGRGAIEPLTKLRQLRGMYNEIDTQLFAGGRAPFFDQYPTSYKIVLVGVIPENTQMIWDNYNRTLSYFTRAIEIILDAEQYQSGSELYDKAVAHASVFQQEFNLATGGVRDW